MSEAPRHVPTFDCPGSQHRIDVAGTAVLTSRTRVEDLGANATLYSDASDAVTLIYLVGDLDRHELRVGDRHHGIAPLPAGRMQIIDMDTCNEARMGRHFDSINFLLPRPAIRGLAEQMGRPEGAGAPGLERPWSVTDPFIDRMMMPLTYVLENGGSIDPLLDEHIILTIVGHLVKKHGGLVEAATLQPGRLTSWQLHRAKELLGDDVGRTVTLLDVARAIDVSPGHLSRAFKRSTGLTPFTWLARRRIDVARSMLEQEDSAISQISARCGFADQSHFTRSFKAITGTTPREWRRLHRGPA